MVKPGDPAGSAVRHPVCNAIIIINVAVFLFEQLTKLDPNVIDTYFAASVDETFRHYRLWQLLTATFFHADIWHLIFNMWFFWIVAREMEPLVRQPRFRWRFISPRRSSARSSGC